MATAASTKVDGRLKGEGRFYIQPAPPPLARRTVVHPSFALALTMVLDGFFAMGLLVAHGVWAYAALAAWALALGIVSIGVWFPGGTPVSGLGHGIARKQLRQWPQTFALVAREDPGALIAVDTDLVRLARIAVWSKNASPGREFVLLGLDPARTDFRPQRLDRRFEEALAAIAGVGVSGLAIAMVMGSRWIAGIPMVVCAITLWIAIGRGIAAARSNCAYLCLLVWRRPDGREQVRQGWERLSWTDATGGRVDEVKETEHLAIAYRVKDFEAGDDGLVDALTRVEN